MEVSGAGGDEQLLALLEDGSIRCWGNNDYGQCNVPDGIGEPGKHVLEAATSGSHVVSLLEDGSIACWGANDSGQCDVPEGVGAPGQPVLDVAAGVGFSVALLENGSLACWGANDSGQCDVPPGVGTLENPVVQVDCGSFDFVIYSAYTIARSKDGSIACWGATGWGTCDFPEGNGGPEDPYSQISAGGTHALLLKQDGSVVVASASINNDGYQFPPLAISSEGNPAERIALGHSTAALRQDGTVVYLPDRWNDVRQDTPPNVGVPLNPTVDIALDWNGSAALLEDGSVVCWDADGPYDPPYMEPAVAIASGGQHFMALGDDGSVTCWGQDNSGQATVPEGLTDIQAIAAGGDTSVALDTSGTVTCWGEVDSVPKGLLQVTEIATGGTHVAVIHEDGSMSCWGANDFGQCDVPGEIGPGKLRATACAAGSGHTVALLEDGTLRCWGDNTAGQCDIPTDVGLVGYPIIELIARDNRTAILVRCTTDCNGNDVCDLVDIAEGTAEDCNGNKVPDTCEQIIDVAVEYHGIPGNDDRLRFETIDLPDSAEETITIEIRANGDLESGAEFFYCYLDDLFLGFAFTEGTYACLENTATFEVDRATWEALAEDGTRVIETWASAAVEAERCGNSRVEVHARFLGFPPDCNDNGTWDGCDIGGGDSTDFDGDTVPDDCQADCDGDGLPDDWATTSGLVPDENENLVPDSCELATGDLNLDGCIDGEDLLEILSLWGLPNPPIGDLDGNGFIDGGDLTILLGNWTGCP